MILIKGVRTYGKNRVGRGHSRKRMIIQMRHRPLTTILVLGAVLRERPKISLLLVC